MNKCTSKLLSTKTNGSLSEDKKNKAVTTNDSSDTGKIIHTRSQRMKNNIPIVVLTDIKNMSKSRKAKQNTKCGTVLSTDLHVADDDKPNILENRGKNEKQFKPTKSPVKKELKLKRKVTIPKDVRTDLCVKRGKTTECQSKILSENNIKSVSKVISQRTKATSEVALRNKSRRKLKEKVFEDTRSTNLQSEYT